MRGVIACLGRCTLICTQGEDTIKRSKPFKYTYEKEIVMYGIVATLRASHFDWSSIGMLTSRNWTTSLPNVFTRLTRIVDMRESFSKTSKRHVQVQSSTSYILEKLSRSRTRSKQHRKRSVWIQFSFSSRLQAQHCIQRHANDVATCRAMSCAKHVHF